MTSYEDQPFCRITKSTYEPGSFADRVHIYIASRTLDELNQNLPGIFQNLNELITWFEGLTGELFLHSTSQLRKILPGSINPEKIEYTLIYQMWDKIGFFLIQNWDKLGLPSYTVISFYRKFLQAFISAQNLSNGKWLRLHKGGIYHNLGIGLLYSGQRDNSKNYFILGMIEDILNQLPIGTDNFKSAPGYNNLKALNVFSNEEKELANLKKIIKKNEKKASRLGLTPEFIFIEFMTDKRNKTKTNQFLLWDNIFFKVFLKETERKSNRNELGYILEVLSAYLFFTIGKFEVSSNIKTIHAEHDLRIRNLIADDPILELLGRYILVECKNWNKKVNSTLIKKFITNVRFSRCDTGVIIAKKNLTGTKNKDSAWYVVRAEYHKDNVVIIVLTLNDLKKIAEEDTNLLEILKMKYEQIRFDER